jgi:uncharacterized protein
MNPEGHPRAMRRAEREITDPVRLQEVLAEAELLFLAIDDHPAPPYVVPVFFAHEGGVLYVHSAREGTKIDLLRKNPRVGFSATAGVSVVPGSSPCDFSARGMSVAGTGTVRIVENAAECTRGLDLIMRRYAGSEAGGSLPYGTGALARTLVFAIQVDTLRGKRAG